MNLYTCSIDLKDSAKALVFAHSVEMWMDHLLAKGVINAWQLFRCKLNLASDNHRDFLLNIAVTDLTQLDRAFRISGSLDDKTDQLYHAVHDMISATDFGLFRPYPDDERAERMALL
ncbi:MAG: hypothetical protein Q9M48_14400 [Rhodobacterales bacterium]|nr:hypothetical protein [Rhodobacterales bacterium]